MLATHEKSFTLIELLVVIVIIAILMSILFPAMNHARNLGKSISCLSNMKQTGLSAQMYVSDSNSYWPMNNVAYANEDYWEYKLAAYGGTFKMFTCPSNDSLLRKNGFMSFENSQPAQITNGLLFGALMVAGQTNYIRDSQVQNHSKTLALCDINAEGKEYDPGFNLNKPIQTSGQVDILNPALRVGFIHLNSANALWADGHASSVRCLYYKDISLTDD